VPHGDLWLEVTREFFDLDLADWLAVIHTHVEATSKLQRLLV
jgi:hypothetical protein